MDRRQRALVRAAGLAISGVLIVSLIAAGHTTVVKRERSRSAPDATQSPDKKYWRHTLGPASVARSGLGAGVAQATNTPSEWGQGAAGFGKRFASSFAKHLVKKGIQYPVSKLFHEELSYRPSGLTGFKPRLKYALLGVVITHKTTTGQRTVAKGELAGAIGSGFISRLWQPASVRTAGAAVSSAGITLGADAAGNVLREFWPEIRHPRNHRREARRIHPKTVLSRDTAGRRKQPPVPFSHPVRAAS